MAEELLKQGMFNAKDAAVRSNTPHHEGHEGNEDNT